MILDQEEQLRGTKSDGGTDTFTGLYNSNKNQKGNGKAPRRKKESNSSMKFEEEAK